MIGTYNIPMPYVYQSQVATLVALALDHLNMSELPEPIMGSGNCCNLLPSTYMPIIIHKMPGKFPPVLKIRGLLHRNGAKTQK